MFYLNTKMFSLSWMYLLEVIISKKGEDVCRLKLFVSSVSF